MQKIEIKFKENLKPQYFKYRYLRCANESETTVFLIQFSLRLRSYTYNLNVFAYLVLCFQVVVINCSIKIVILQ